MKWATLGISRTVRRFDCAKFLRQNAWKGLPMQSCTKEMDSYRERLLLEHLPQVRHIARRIHERLPPQVPFEDLVQCGVLGLIDAVRRYDPHKKVKLRYYAEFRIRGAILDGLREGDHASRAQRRIGRKMQAAIERCRLELGRDPTESEVASFMGVRLDELQRIKSELRTLEKASSKEELFDVPAETLPLAADQEQDPFHEALKSEQSRLVEQALKGLSARERRILDMYYLKENTMKDIAAEMHVGESRISQIHASALSRLRTRLRVSS